MVPASFLKFWRIVGECWSCPEQMEFKKDFLKHKYIPYHAYLPLNIYSPLSVNLCEWTICSYSYLQHRVFLLFFNTYTDEKLFDETSLHKWRKLNDTVPLTPCAVGYLLYLTQYGSLSHSTAGSGLLQLCAVGRVGVNWCRYNSCVLCCVLLYMYMNITKKPENYRCPHRYVGM